MGNELLTGFLAGQSEGGGNNNGNGGGFFGNEGLWAVIILAIIFGWGNGNGLGGRNNGGSNGGDNVTVVPYPAPSYGMGFGGGALTRADLCQDMNFNNLESGVRGIQQGICDSTFALNNTITSGNNALQMGMMQGFNGVDRAVCNLGYQNQAGFNALGNQLASCCCDIKSAVGDVKYQMASDTCAIQNTIQGTARDIIDNQNANYRGLMDFMVQSKIDALQAENQNLKLAASQAAQNGYIDAIGNSIVARLQQPQPVPSYQVPAPYPYCVSQNGGCDCGGNRCC